MTIDEAIDAVEKKEPFFGSLIRRLKVVEDNKNCPTLGTDGEYLYHNSNFTKKLTNDEFCAVVLHEIFHCVFTHMWRRQDRDMMGWNMATDYAINTIVNENFPLPKGSLLDMKYYGMPAEDIYDSLPKLPKHKCNGNCQSGHAEGEAGGDHWCDKSGWPDHEKNKKESWLDKITGKKKKKSNAAANKARWNKIFRDKVLKEYGQLPNSIKRLIEKTHYVPTVDWSALVAGILSEDENDYTFSSPDRRFMDEDFFLPGLSSIDRLKDVVFAYDTSGSIMDDDLKSFYMETVNLFENFSSLQGWVAICDARLHSFKEIDPRFDSYANFGFMGGGGTNFNPVFDEVKKRSMRPKALFYFTDTYGDYPQEKPEYPVFWLVRSQIGENEKLDVPFGTVVRFLSKS